jgi:hypothetical protein
VVLPVGTSAVLLDSFRETVVGVLFHRWRSVSAPPGKDGEEETRKTGRAGEM